MTSEALWFKDAIIYQTHVRAFSDSVGDGIGDFRGLTERLDYLEDLGITTIWLLPFYPSPLKDDGYDIADYTSIHPHYGTLEDFRAFLDAAHRRNLRVITELVLNHTSDQHPWFQRARRAVPGSPERDFYVWSDTPEKYTEARIIFKDFEQSNWTWDPVAKAYFWHRFYSHQPDLNYDSPLVARTMYSILDFWMELGVDGMRLDAVPYLYEREGTNCENLSETHEYLRKLRSHIDQRFPNRMLLAEANQWPEDAVAYFGKGDENHMAFHFPLMPRMFMALRMEDRFPIIDILAQTPAIPDNCQWALFLRNHDELTLEMVTDEERDYMYRMYARDPRARINLGIRRRLAPLLDNNRRRIELMNGLLFSLPGTPVVYYGDEIGMGDNIYLGDRNGVRTPMQWNSDRNAGFSRANPQKLYLPIIIDPEYHYEANNVEAQQNNPSSLLWWTKRLIALRKRYKAFGRGTLEFLYPDNHKVLAFVRRYENELILVVANLSRFVQYVELNLGEFKGRTPVELFGRTAFPRVGDLPYLLTMAPHSFYWFSLEPQEIHDYAGAATPGASSLPVINVPERWENIFQDPAKGSLEEVLPTYLKERRWFGGKAKQIRAVEVQEAVPLHCNSTIIYLAILRTDYLDADPETYVMPLTASTGDREASLLADHPHMVVAKLVGSVQGILHEAVTESAFATGLLQAIADNRSFHGNTGELMASRTSAFSLPADSQPLEPSVSRAEQSNTSIVFGNRMILKLFRKTDEGINPDLEIGRFLTARGGAVNVPPVLGAIEYRRSRYSEPMTLGVLQALVPDVEDAWKFTQHAVGQYFERVLTIRPQSQSLSLSTDALLAAASEDDLPDEAYDRVETYLDSARLLGERTAQMHRALASESDDPAFAPEPFSPHYQRSIYQSMRNLTSHSFGSLDRRLKSLPSEVEPDARRVLERRDEVFQRFRTLLQVKVNTMRIRCHGDYHLGQVLYTGKDFVIIDFEGEPLRSLSERRIKRSPLRDVAGMLRSYHYAAYSGLIGHLATREAAGGVRPEDVGVLEPWARHWYFWVSSAFLKGYLQGAEGATFLPKTRRELLVLLDAFLLEKAIYELAYELAHRPSWLRIPLQGILQLLETADDTRRTDNLETQAAIPVGGH